MFLSAKIREQIISSFRAELSEHVQTMTQGLLALEQNQVSGEQREETLTDIFRAAHSLKGAARAVSVTAIEQLAHALEDVLGGIQRGEFQLTTGLYTACYQALDAIQAVEAAFEAGKTTPPQQALEALVNLDMLPKGPSLPSLNPAPAAAAPISTAPAPAAPAPAAAPKPLPPQPAASEPGPSEPANSRRSKSSGKAIQDGLDSLTGVLEQSFHESMAKDAPAAPVEAKVEKVENVEKPEQPEPEAPAPSLIPAPRPVVDETIRVSVNKLDSLMAQLSELLITKIHADQLLSQLQQARDFIGQWQKEWLLTRNSYAWVERQNGDGVAHASGQAHFNKELSRVLSYVNHTQDGLRELSALINNLMQQHQSDVMQMAMVIDRLEDEIKRVRMLPVSTITESFGRMVRDLAQAAGKKAMFELRGGEVELDKGVLEKIKDPIIHILRNAVDHGIESPARRIALGKPPQGTVTLAVEAIGREIVISVSDDGDGLDLEAIRRAAARRGIGHTQEMTQEEVVQLIFTSGFSTHPIITDISGRGIGLDVVRRNIEQLHGKVNVDWRPGQGARFTITLPLTLTSSHALLVRAADQWFAIPLNTIERILYVKREEVNSIGANDTILFEDQQIMLARLSQVLELPPVPNPAELQALPVVVLSSSGRRMAFVVEELGDEQEVVVKTLGKQFVYLGGIAGAHLMGNGDVLLVLNVGDLIKLALRSEQSSAFQVGATSADQAPAKAQKRNILVVDDSITTRTLEKNILEAAGYNVRLAINGMEALNAIRIGDLPDLVISDVVMPRLDGCGLAKQIKSEPRTAKIPVILVTSLDSPEDKARGIDSGADAYIVKSTFDQTNLLETIQQLI